MKKYTILFAILCLGIVSVNAQTRSLTSLQYSVGFGTGDMGSFISKPSFRGATFDWRKHITDNVAAGIEVGWNVFYDGRPYDTYTAGNIAITGKQYRYQNQVPLLAGVDYYMKPGEDFNPFVGLGIGTMYSRRNTDMSQYTLEEQAWHFALRPEVGFLYQLNPETAVLVALKYYNGFQAGDLKQTQSYLALNVGLAFLK